MKIERVLVTGGAGFIGSHTVDLLLQQGKQVVVLDNLSTGRVDNLDLTHPALEFIEGDILEYPLIVDLLNSCDALLHLAAIASVPQSISEPIYTFQVNMQGFLHALQATRSVRRPGESRHPVRLVYASSAAVYGNEAALPCDDATPLISELLSPYALQKKHNEEYAGLYARLHNISSLGLRYFNIYGPRQRPDSPYSGVISRFLDAYQKDTELTIFGDGQQSRDFIHVSDIAKVNVLALESDYTGVLNVATGISQTLLQLIEYMEVAGGRPAKRRFQPARVGDIKASSANIATLTEKLAFKAEIPLQEGIRQLLNSI